MRFDVISLFPEMFSEVLGASIVNNARESGILTIGLHNLRDFGEGRRRSVDDRPYGGGPGMVMMADPICKAVEAVRVRAYKEAGKKLDSHCILLCPQGQTLSSSVAKKLALREHLILICGRYEGVDERVRELLVDQELSIGDYVLTGGELPAMVLIDCVARYVPGVIGHEAATVEESFAEGLLEYPQYTRPQEFQGRSVPAVLLSGDHQAIADWRRAQSETRTRLRRPDLTDL